MPRARPTPQFRRVPAVIAGSLLVIVATGCSDDGRELRLPRPDQDESIITTTSAPEDAVSFDVSSLPGLDASELEISVPWTNDGEIPAQFTCRGDDVSPNVAWFDVSPAAVSMAIVMYEESLDRTVYWIVANLDPATAFIDVDSVPLDAVIGLNDPVLGTSQVGYRGPCPPAGETRSYTIEVHALSQYLDLSTGTPAGDLISAIDMASIQMSSVTGSFTG